MNITEIPPEVKLIAAVTFQHESQLNAVESFLTQHFGAVDLRTPDFAFDFTDYYRDEMGENLHKIFFSFERLVERERLPGIKLLTNEYEFSVSERDKRTVNIDPGYICEASLILASTGFILARASMVTAILFLKTGYSNPNPGHIPTIGKNGFGTFSQKYEKDITNNCMTKKLFHKPAQFPRSSTLAVRH